MKKILVVSPFNGIAGGFLDVFSYVEGDITLMVTDCFGNLDKWHKETILREKELRERYKDAKIVFAENLLMYSVRREVYKYICEEKITDLYLDCCYMEVFDNEVINALGMNHVEIMGISAEEDMNGTPYVSGRQCVDLCLVFHDDTDYKKYLLVGNRAEYKKEYAGCLALPGGGVDNIHGYEFIYESYYTSLYREAMEETGLKLTINNDEVSIEGLKLASSKVIPFSLQSNVPNKNERSGGSTQPFVIEVRGNKKAFDKKLNGTDDLKNVRLIKLSEALFGGFAYHQDVPAKFACNYCYSEIREEIGKILDGLGGCITSVESCTCGALLTYFTEPKGASNHVKGGYNTYSNEMKEMIGGDTMIRDIKKYTVYSDVVAEEMARIGVKSMSATIGVGITGMLGNIDPANPDSKDVGRVYVGIIFDEKRKNIRLNRQYFGKYLDGSVKCNKDKVKIAHLTLDVRNFDREVQRRYVCYEAVEAIAKVLLY